MLDSLPGYDYWKTTPPEEQGEPEAEVPSRCQGCDANARLEEERLADGGEAWLCDACAEKNDADKTAARAVNDLFILAATNAREQRDELIEARHG
jgi:hypothetical protein